MVCDNNHFEYTSLLKHKAISFFKMLFIYLEERARERRSRERGRSRGNRRFPAEQEAPKPNAISSEKEN